MKKGYSNADATNTTQLSTGWYKSNQDISLSSESSDGIQQLDKVMPAGSLFNITGLIQDSNTSLYWYRIEYQGMKYDIPTVVSAQNMMGWHTNPASPDLADSTGKIVGKVAPTDSYYFYNEPSVLMLVSSGAQIPLNKVLYNNTVYYMFRPYMSKGGGVSMVDAPQSATSTNTPAASGASLKTSNTDSRLAVIPQVMSSVGFLAGLYFAYTKKSKFWGYVGYGVLGSIVLGTVGGIGYKIIKPKP